MSTLLSWTWPVMNYYLLIQLFMNQQCNTILWVYTIQQIRIQILSFFSVFPWKCKEMKFVLNSDIDYCGFFCQVRWTWHIFHCRVSFHQSYYPRWDETIVDGQIRALQYQGNEPKSSESIDSINSILWFSVF